MIEYLKEFVRQEEYELIFDSLTEKQIDNFEVMENNVIEVIVYLKELKISNITNIIIKRPDLFFRSIDTLKELFASVDKDLLFHILEYEPTDLINFNI